MGREPSLYVLFYEIAAAGVTYHDSKGQHYEVRVRSGGEVILSAGALGSPQLLLISGVGPAANLSSMRIPVVRDHPFVGQFMARNGINLVVPVTLPDAGSVRVAGITEIGPYIESVSVPPLTPPLHFIPFLGSHLPINFSIEVIGTKVSRAVATGSLNLLSPSDVTVTPSVRFNYFSNPEDIRQCGNGIEIIRKMLETEALEEFKFPDFNGGRSFRYMGPSLPDDPSDEEAIVTFCRETLGTVWHMHGGCLVNKVVGVSIYGGCLVNKVVGVSRKTTLFTK
ncbi:(R)-mandelonitrile lyase-like protein [Tanacetum coccineum]